MKRVLCCNDVVPLTGLKHNGAVDITHNPRVHEPEELLFNEF